MNEAIDETVPAEPLDSGLCGLCAIAAYYRIAADPRQLARELALTILPIADEDIVRASQRIGLRARALPLRSARRLASTPIPAVGFSIWVETLTQAKNSSGSPS